ETVPSIVTRRFNRPSPVLASPIRSANDEQHAATQEPSGFRRGGLLLRSGLLLGGRFLRRRLPGRRLLLALGAGLGGNERQRLLQCDVFRRLALGQGGVGLAVLHIGAVAAVQHLHRRIVVRVGAQVLEHF